MIAPSIRRSLLWRCGLGLVVVWCLLAAGIYLLVRQSFYREMDSAIQQTAELLSNQVELENGMIMHEWQEGLAVTHSQLDGAWFQFWDEKTGTTLRSPSLHWHDLPQFNGLEGKPLWRNIILPNGQRGRAVGIRFHPFVLPEEVARMKERGEVIDPKSWPHVLVVARDAEHIHRSLDKLRWILLGGALFTLALGVVLIDRAVRASLRPIDTLTQQVVSRREHQLDEALEMPGAMPAELVGLARTFDRLLGRVAAIRQRERDFIRHASHELRTPIAGLLAQSELALSQSRDATAYAGYLQQCRASALHLAELVKRLSALAKIGGQEAAPQSEAVDLRELLESAAAVQREAAVRRGLAFDLPEWDGACVIQSDPALLRIVINNLFDNAVSYAVPESTIQVALRQSPAGISLAVANRVADLPEDFGRWFEPLFRRESSRFDANAHLGIGLTLSREAAHALGGTLVAQRGHGADWIEFVLEVRGRGI